MVIQHNISALNSHRNLGINNSATAKNLEKLSSGYRINRAGDDAAGLAISEKMRGQIRGLAMAEQNTENGISLIQTAEGGLNETHAILQRMRELSVQASNGTYQDDDRKQIAIEVQALKDEIDRISSSTHYNGIKLLDGSLGGVYGSKLEAGTATGGSNTYDAGSLAALANQLAKFGFATSTKDSTNGVEAFGTIKLDVLFDDMKGQEARLIYKDEELYLQIGDKTYKAVEVPADGTNPAEYGREDGTDLSVHKDAAHYVFVDSEGNNVAVLQNSSDGTAANSKYLAANTDDFVIAGISLSDSGYGTDLAAFPGAGTDVESTAIAENHALYNAMFADDKSKLIFQIGANGGADQRVDLHVFNMSTACLGTEDDKIFDISILTREEANDAIKVIDAATNQVSAQRAGLGALQNRLEHTLNNLGVTKENLTAAESTIRDVDMAKEMMEFTKNNILVQASQAMLAQANALPQGILSLLR